MSESSSSETQTVAIPTEGLVTVALIEDNRMVREALTLLLNRSSAVRVVCDDSNADDSMLREFSPDVVLLDLGLENGDSLRIARNVLEGFPDARVVVMDLLPSHEELTAFVSAGVSGFVMKDASLDVVVATILTVAAGLKVLPDQMTGTLFSEIAEHTVSNGGTRDRESVEMTPREREVIELIADGMSNKAIAKELHISIHTVKSHLRNIMDKLTLHSRLEIALYHREHETESAG